MTHRQEMRPRRSIPLALAWLSIGIGLVEVLMTRRVARAIGMRGQEGMLFACGVREIATGAAILAARNPAPFVWARVGGDALDLAILGRQAAVGGAQADRATLATLGVAGITAVDVACARVLDAESRMEETAVRFDYSERSGMPLPVSQMRGAAREDFVPPEDMRVPQLLRAYGTS